MTTQGMLLGVARRVGLQSLPWMDKVVGVFRHKDKQQVERPKLNYKED